MSPAPVLDQTRDAASRGHRLIERYRKRVLRAFNGEAERIVLFGSRARGEAHAESDWDFAVFLSRAPTEEEERRLREASGDVGRASGEIQSWLFGRERWLAADELACRIRDEGVVIHGPAEVPMIKPPTLQHARDSLAKADRFAQQAARTAPEHFETVVHNSYYAVFHAARAALLAVEGTATTKHGRAGEAFARMVRRRRDTEGRRHAEVLQRAYALRIDADYKNVDLTDAARRLRDAVVPFLAFCRGFIEQQPDQA